MHPPPGPGKKVRKVVKTSMIMIHHHQLENLENIIIIISKQIIISKPCSKMGKCMFLGGGQARRMDRGDGGAANVNRRADSNVGCQRLVGFLGIDGLREF